MITSFDNGRIKALRKLLSSPSKRREAGLFTVEGLKMSAEAPGDITDSIFISETLKSRLKKGELSKTLTDKLDSFGYYCIRDDIFQRITDTRTPQGIITVLRPPMVAVEDVLSSGGDRPAFIMGLESIQDPGNMGTIIRCAEAAGAGYVMVNDTCTDPYGPKAVRASAGSIFRIPVITTSDMPGSIERLKALGVRVYATRLDGSIPHTEPDYTGSVMFLIGNEGQGLSDDLSRLADEYIRIPMEGMVESLNAAIAATIMMYEVHRQRNTKFFK